MKLDVNHGLVRFSITDDEKKISLEKLMLAKMTKDIFYIYMDDLKLNEKPEIEIQSLKHTVRIFTTDVAVEFGPN